MSGLIAHRGLLLGDGGAGDHAAEFVAKVVAYYPFDDDVASVVGAPNPFSIGTAPAYVASAIGQGIELNSVLDTAAYVPALSTKNWSLGGWFNVASTNGPIDIFLGRAAVGGAYETGAIGNYTSGWSAYAGPNTVLASGVSAVVGEWTHVIATYDGTSLKCYVDGALVATLATSTAIQDGSNLELGYAFSNDYGVSVDECFICDAPLSAECIAYLYNGGAGRSWGQINA